MENNNKCSFKTHKESDAISYCQDCKIFMCNKCLNHHKELFENHRQQDLGKDTNEIFIDVCKEINHPLKLQYFCKNHNKLCCAACISKLEGEGNGQHKDCNICFIKNIIKVKKNKLNENIKYLEDLSNNLENLLNELKILFDKINKRKEELKLKIQNTFTRIRNALNKREDDLLLEVDDIYNGIYYNEEIIRESEKLPNKIKTSLEKGKLINKEWDDKNKMSSIINDCINIEDNIKNIELINNNIKKCKSNSNIKIEFFLEEENIDNFIQIIKAFGKILNQNLENLDSVIIKNKDVLNNFYKLISNKIKIHNIKLIYRPTKDGLQFSNMKDKINNKSNLIFLFFTGNKRIFGAFIKSKLENIEESKYFKDENAFVFSLDNNKIYKILIPEKALRFCNNYPILIGNNSYNNGFYFNNNSSEIYDEGLLNNPKIYDFQKKRELTEGFNKFTELEIYEINN